MRKRQRRWSRPVWILGGVTALAVATGSFLVADTLTRPLDVRLRTHIEIYQRGQDGGWEMIDEVGPANRRFQATLLEMARGKEIGTDFVFRTKTKKGKDYSVRLLDPADVAFNPATGKFDADLVFEIGLDGKKARVEAKTTTEGRSTPVGSLRGKRAKGILGRSPTTVTLVSANELRLPGEAPMLLVCEEEYRMTPK